jgi:hypothetical protein
MASIAYTRAARRSQLLLAVSRFGLKAWALGMPWDEKHEPPVGAIDWR